MRLTAYPARHKRWHRHFSWQIALMKDLDRLVEPFRYDYSDFLHNALDGFYPKKKDFEVPFGKYDTARACVIDIPQKALKVYLLQGSHVIFMQGTGNLALIEDTKTGACVVLQGERIKQSLGYGIVGCALPSDQQPRKGVEDMIARWSGYFGEHVTQGPDRWEEVRKAAALIRPMRSEELEHVVERGNYFLGKGRVRPQRVSDLMALHKESPRAPADPLAQRLVNALTHRLSTCAPK